MYKFIKATKKDRNLLISYKLKIIYNDNSNLNKEEQEEIENYVNNNISKQLKNYKLVSFENNIIGCVLIKKFEDSYLLEELYIEDSYRNKGIGTKIIQDLINTKKILYLWVYKNNTKAIKLYEKLNFKIIDESQTRYKMKIEI